MAATKTRRRFRRIVIPKFNPPTVAPLAPLPAALVRALAALDNARGQRWQ